MVFKGKASRGCENCRKLHTKCDEQRPECSRCVRMKRHCSGYRDEVDLIFQVAAARKESSHELRVKQSRRSTTASVSNQSQIHSAMQIGSQSQYPLGKVGRVLLPSIEDQSLCFFYRNTLDALVDTEHAYYLHLQLPTLYSQSKASSALYLATQAISLAVWAKSRPNDIKATHSSRMRYVQSLLALKIAIQDPVEVKSDETLYTVLLVTGYETITFDLETLHAWGAHVDGAAALIKNRGAENFCTPFACNMFLFLRRNAIQSHLQLSTPLDSIFHEFADISYPYENIEDQLLSKTVHIPKLQFLVNSLLSRPISTVDVIEVVRLMRAAEEVDHKLASWADRIPVQWSYTTVMCINPQISSSRFIPTEIHRYPNLYTARVWNLYRVYRLITQSILSRVSSSMHRRSTECRGHIEKLNRNMVDDLCASVPFLLGLDLSQLKHCADSLTYSSSPSLWPQSSIHGASSPRQTGKFSLIWPLHIACSVPLIPETQQMWMREQLRWIAESGEAQAHFIRDAKSQTLTGGPESFRFDCV